MHDVLEIFGGGAAVAPDPLARVGTVMSARGVTVPRAVFHGAVKTAFFASGAEFYDEASRNLWESLPQQFQLLAGDYLAQQAPVSTRMTALDVGCGTGMSAEIVLRSRIGAFIRQMDLLDTSEEMLRLCEERETLRGIRHRPIQGGIQDVPERYHYDLILAGCVLQHIPELPEFLRQVSLRQRPGGVFLHVQDPNGDYLNDPERLERVARLARSLSVRPSTLLKRLSAARPWIRNHTRAGQMEAINQQLLQRTIITSRLTEPEIRMMVDLPAHDWRGISICQMQDMMPDYELVSCRSYAFFGELISDLPPAYQRRERELIAGRAVNGSQVAAIWMKRAKN